MKGIKAVSTTRGMGHHWFLTLECLQGMHAYIDSTLLAQGEGASASLPPTLDPTMMMAQGYNSDGMLRLVGKSVPAALSPGVVPARFWAAGFSFSRADIITEVSITARPTVQIMHHSEP